jgi:hypothetical protein
MDLNEEMTDEELKEMLTGANNSQKNKGDFVSKKDFFNILNKSNA